MTVTHERIGGIDLLASTWGASIPHDQFDRLRAEARRQRDLLVERQGMSKA